MEQREAFKFDYNDETFRHGTEEHGMDYSILLPEFRDIHVLAADRIASRNSTPVLDLGCGPTKLGTLLDERGVPWVGVDAAIKRLQLGRGDRVLGDATRLPFEDGTFGTVAALYMLYQFDDPLVPIREAFRVLRPGGYFAACAPSRYDDPELAEFMASVPLGTFDSDNGAELIGSVFEIIGKDSYDMPLYRFPTRNGLWNYLVSVGYEADLADDIARRVEIPLWLTKRGATIWARKPA